MPIRDWAVSMKRCSVLSTRKMKCSRSVSEKTGAGQPIWQGYGQETMWRHSSGHITSGTTSPCLNLRPTSSRSSPCSFPTKPEPIWQGYGQETMWRHSSGHITSGTTSPCLNLRPTSSRSSPCSFPTKPDCTTVRYGKTACG